METMTNSSSHRLVLYMSIWDTGVVRAIWALPGASLYHSPSAKDHPWSSYSINFPRFTLSLTILYTLKYTKPPQITFIPKREREPVGKKSPKKVDPRSTSIRRYPVPNPVFPLTLFQSVQPVPLFSSFSLTSYVYFYISSSDPEPIDISLQPQKSDWLAFTNFQYVTDPPPLPSSFYAVALYLSIRFTRSITEVVISWGQIPFDSTPIRLCVSHQPQPLGSSGPCDWTLCPSCVYDRLDHFSCV
jgi:hypothetical protein